MCIRLKSPDRIEPAWTPGQPLSPKQLDELNDACERRRIALLAAPGQPGPVEPAYLVAGAVILGVIAALVSIFLTR